MQPITLTKKFEFTPKILACIMTDAIEGSSYGIAYWCSDFFPVAPENWEKLKDEGENSKFPWYCQEAFWSSDWKIRFIDAEEGETSKYSGYLTSEMVAKGAQLFADKYPKEMEAYCDEERWGENDAGDAETFVQLCCFGEVIFG